MTRHRLLNIFVALGATVALGLLTPLPAHAAQTQTIAFTSTPPAGQDWLTYSHPFFHEYIATATASSGLPVEFSIAPASADVCSIAGVYHDDPTGSTGADIDFLGGGTCTVWADQPGDGDFLPAPRVTQSFQVERVQTSLPKVKGKKGVPGKKPATFSATLQTLAFVDSRSIGPVPFLGQIVTFSVAGKPVCSGVTGAYGIATCQGIVPRADGLRLRFTASYAGDDDYKPSSKNGYFGF